MKLERVSSTGDNTTKSGMALEVLENKQETGHTHGADTRKATEHLKQSHGKCAVKFSSCGALSLTTVAHGAEDKCERHKSRVSNTVSQQRAQRTQTAHISSTRN